MSRSIPSSPTPMPRLRSAKVMDTTYETSLYRASVRTSMSVETAGLGEDLTSAVRTEVEDGMMSDLVPRRDIPPRLMPKVKSTASSRGPETAARQRMLDATAYHLSACLVAELDALEGRDVSEELLWQVIQRLQAEVADVERIHLDIRCSHRIASNALPPPVRWIPKLQKGSAVIDQIGKDGCFADKQFFPAFQTTQRYAHNLQRVQDGEINKFHDADGVNFIEGGASTIAESGQ